MLSDVASSYDQMEQSIETEFAKLTQDARRNKGALEDKIKELERQIAKLKDDADKIARIARKIDDVLPKFMAALGSDTGGGNARTPSTKRDQLAAQLSAELAGQGLSLSPDELQGLVGALAKGGSAGMALAVQLVTTIANGRTRGINDQIASAGAAIQDRKTQIAALDKQIAKLDLEKAKALEDAKKAQNARLIRLPTPTPARKP